MSLETAQQRRKKAMDRLLRQLAMRQQYVDKQGAEMEAEQAAMAEEERKAAEQEKEMSYGRSAHQGAATGGAIMPGWGHLIGGIIGSGIGSYKKSKDEGSGVGGFFKSMLSPEEEFNSLAEDPQSQQIALSAAGAGAANIARNDTAKKNEKRRAEDQQFQRDLMTMNRGQQAKPNEPDMASMQLQEPGALEYGGAQSSFGADATADRQQSKDFLAVGGAPSRYDSRLTQDEEPLYGKRRM